MEEGAIPFVQRVRTSSGLRLYFRRGNVRRPLRSQDGSPELRQEVEAILADLSRVERAQTPKPGTVGGMIVAYRRSADFLGLAKSTQADYHRRLDEISADVGAVFLADVTAAWVAEMRNVWAPRGYRVANLNLQMLINSLGPAIEDGRIKTDPFARLKKARRSHDAAEPNPIWEDSEVEAVIKLAIARKMPGLARAVALGRWAGFRRGTICAVPLHIRVIGHDDWGRSQRRLYWLTEKGRVLCDKPEDQRLTALLEATPSAGLTIAYNRKGEPFKERALNQAIDRLIYNLAAQAEVRSNLTLHGLRHSRGVELAIAGASDSEIMSQLEHATVRSAQIYRRQAERRKLADSGQAKVDQIRKRQRARRGPVDK